MCFCITAKLAADVREGSKPEKLNASKCFPLFTQQRTSPRYFGMSVSCHKPTFAAGHCWSLNAPVASSRGARNDAPCPADLASPFHEVPVAELQIDMGNRIGRHLAD